MKLFSKEYVENGGNATQAALKAYDADYVQAKNIGNQNLDKPIVQDEIKRQLEKAGITEEYLHEKSKHVIDLIDDEDPKTLPTATNHLQFAYKLHNAIPASKHDVRSVSLNVTNDVNLIKDQIKANTDKLNALLEVLSS